MKIPRILIRTYEKMKINIVLRKAEHTQPNPKKETMG
jgi:hypothetical protein